MDPPSSHEAASSSPTAASSQWESSVAKRPSTEQEDSHNKRGRVDGPLIPRFDAPASVSTLGAGKSGVSSIHKVEVVDDSVVEVDSVAQANVLAGFSPNEGGNEREALTGTGVAALTTRATSDGASLEQEGRKQQEEVVVETPETIAASTAPYAMNDTLSDPLEESGEPAQPPALEATAPIMLWDLSDDILAHITTFAAHPVERVAVVCQLAVVNRRANDRFLRQSPGLWMALMQQDYGVMGDPANPDVLGQAREAHVDFLRARPAESVPMRWRLRQLDAYHEEHGHINVPLDYPERNNLGEYVRLMRWARSRRAPVSIELVRAVRRWRIDWNEGMGDD